MVLLGRVEPGTTYWETVFPAWSCSGSGSSLTVAPLTATVLGAVDDAHAGHRVGDQQLGRAHRGPARDRGAAGRRRAHRRAGPRPRRRLRAAMYIAAVLAAVGGVLAFFTIRRAVFVEPVVHGNPGHSLLRQPRCAWQDQRHDLGTPSATPGTPFDVVIEIPRGSRNKYEYDHEHARDPARPAAVLGHRVPGRLRLRPRHARRRRRSARRAGAARGPDLPRLLGRGARRSACSGWRTRRAPTPRSSASRRTTPTTTTSHDIGDLPQRLLDEIEHFFDVYKMLEPEKNSTTRGYEGRDVAYAEIEASRLRFQSSA